MKTISLDQLVAVTGGTVKTPQKDTIDSKGKPVDAELGSWLKKNGAITQK